MFNFFNKSYHHLNKVLISTDRLKYNHRVLQQIHPEIKVCHVLKSNAYGHSIAAVAHIFDSLESPFIVVDSLYEAYELQKLKVKTPILIMGYTHPDNFKVKHLPFHIAVFDIEVAKTLNKYQPGCSVHLFVDTGMSREGIPLSDLPTFISELVKLNNMKIVGLASHFADADNPESLTFTHQQISQYHKALKMMTDAGLNISWRHISASAGATKINDPVFNMLRVGIASYGISPLAKNDSLFQKDNLKPALKFISTLAQIKTIPKGAQVGYGLTFTAKKEVKLGLVPAGYYEGVDRKLSNIGWVKLKNTYCRIVGRVSMNMTTIDISNVFKPEVGDEVEIYSHNPDDKNSIETAAEIAGTIPYELLVHIAESVKREKY